LGDEPPVETTQAGRKDQQEMELILTVYSVARISLYADLPAPWDHFSILSI
jgi:hypothetical protein